MALPFKQIRVPIPRPGHRMNSIKDYDRRNEKSVIEEELSDLYEEDDDETYQD